MSPRENHRQTRVEHRGSGVAWRSSAECGRTSSTISPPSAGRSLRRRCAPSSPPLAQFFTRVLHAIHVPAAHYYVTDLASLSLAGFLVSQRTGAAEAIRPLATLFQVDAVETDHKLVFKADWDLPEARLKGVRSLVAQLAEIAGQGKKAA